MSQEYVETVAGRDGVSCSIDWMICVNCRGQAALGRELDGSACTPYLHNLALQLELLLLCVHQLELCT